MIWPIYITLALLCATVSSISSSKNNVSLNFVIKLIVRNFPRNRITLIVQSARNLSSTSQLLVNGFSKVLPTALAEINDNKSAKSVEPDRMLNSLRQWEEKEVVKIVIFDDLNDKDINEELMRIIDYLVINSPRSTLPKCLILVTTKLLKNKFTRFFQYGWMHDFLDVTVVEILECTEKTVLSIYKHKNFKAKYHYYNPFSDHYIIGWVGPGVNLIPNKAKNLQNRPLRVSITRTFPNFVFDENYTGQNFWDALIGDQKLLMNVIAATLNSSIHVVSTNRGDIDLTKFNISHASPIDSLNNKTIDLVLPTALIVPVTTPQNKSYSVGCITELNPTQIIVRQRGVGTVVISLKILIMLSLVVFFIASTAIILHLFKSRTNIWTPINIIKILLKAAIFPWPGRLSDKFIFLIVTYLSISLGEQVLEKLMDIYFIQNTYSELKTIEDLVESEITPTVFPFTEKFIEQNFKDFPVMQKLISKSKIEHNVHCLRQLVQEQDDVQGCEVTRAISKLILKNYPQTKHGSKLTMVDEPIFLGLNAMIFAKTSPYASEIDKIWNRLRDSGISNFFHQITMNDFILANEYVYLRNDDLHLQKSVSTFNEDGLINLPKSLLLILATGCVFGIIAFIMEVILNCYFFKTDIPKLKPIFKVTKTKRQRII